MLGNCSVLSAWVCWGGRSTLVDCRWSAWKNSLQRSSALMKRFSHVIGSIKILTGKLLDFWGKKYCDRVKRAKSELKKLMQVDLDLPEKTELHINESLCPNCSGLWNQCEKLWNRPKLFSFFTANGLVRIKLQENESYNIITYIDDLKEIFPDEDVLVQFACFLHCVIF